jgi:hypothetical protein
LQRPFARLHEARQGGEDPRQFDQALVPQGRQPSWILSPEIAIKGVDEHREGNVAFELCGPAREDQVTGLVTEPAELPQEARLPYSRLPADGERDASSPRQAVDRGIETRHLL